VDRQPGIETFLSNLLNRQHQPFPIAPHFQIVENVPEECPACAIPS
jgi:hypothetical protein